MPFGVDQNTAQAAQPAASETVSGIVELATAAEVAAGTDTARAITPAGLAAGQIKFPATQNASADANTLDDYEEGTWTPVLTCGTPGNLSVAYSLQGGDYVKIGKTVWINFLIITSTFTHTTASGELKITGIPFTVASRGLGSLDLQGVTKATYTNFVAQTDNSTFITLWASGTAVGRSQVLITECPTGGTMALISSHTYIV